MQTSKASRKALAAKAVSCLMALVLAFYALPAQVLMHPQRAYAQDGAAPLDVAGEVAAAIDGESAGLSEQEAEGLTKEALKESGHHIYVNYLFCEASEISEGETMDSAWLEKNGEPLLGQTRGISALYDAGGDAYVAFIGDAEMAGGNKAIDWSFTEMNLDGIAVDGIDYDAEAGIAYVPKSLFFDDGVEMFYGIQAQLLVPIDLSEKSSVHVECVNNRGDVTAPARDQEVQADPFAMEVKVQVATPETAGAIGIGDIKVARDDAEGTFGALVEGENASYDNKTGVLTLSCAPASTGKLTVTVEPDGIVEALTGADEAHAAVADGLSTLPYFTFTNLDLSQVSVGQRFSYLSYFNHRATATGGMKDAIEEAETKTAPYGYSWTDNTTATAIVENQTYALSDWILGGNTYTADRVMQVAMANGALSNSTADNVGYTIDLPGAEGRSTVVDGLDFQTRKEAGAPAWRSLAAYCGHNTEALGNQRGTVMAYGAQAEGTVHMRVLAKGDDYVVLGFLSPILNSQAGAAIYKMPVESKGAVEVNKSSANPSITNGNSCYSLSGAVFDVLNASGGTVATLTTNGSGYGKAEGIARGTYTLRERTAPAGYMKAADRSVTVTAGQTTTVNISDEPRNDPDRVRVWKSDAESPNHLPEGAATLAGAEFTFRYYAGYYNQNNLPTTPTRTWVMRTNANGEASPLFGNAYKVSGDAFYTNSTGGITIPLGTVAAVETKAPVGYHLDNGKSGTETGPPKQFVSQIVSTAGNQYGATTQPVNYSGVENLSTLNTPISHDTVYRGNLELVKRDSATADGKAQGAATLAGAAYEVVNQNDAPVISPEDGRECGKGSVVCTIVTDASGYASTTRADLNGWKVPDGTDANLVGHNGEAMDFEGKALAKGTYLVRECRAATGYNLNEEWTATIAIDEDGQLASVETTDDVIRGDVALTKAHGRNQKRLANIPFLITSKTTGEAHVAVTDENGMLSTEARFNKHTANTNANDAAYSQGTVNDALLDPAAGIWFDGRAGDNGAAADDAIGALPYDTYTVEELSCSANVGLTLVDFEVTVSRDSYLVDLGTVDDNVGPYIATTLADDEETHSVPAGEQAVLTDHVEYRYFDEGTYRFAGEVHLVAADGADAGVVAKAEKTVQVRQDQGYVDMAYVIDTTGAAGMKYVCFERCYDASGELVAEHADAADEHQTVHVPTAQTTFTDAADGDHEAPSVGTVTLRDSVRYTGLTPEKQYTVKLTVHKKADDGTDAGVMVGANGNDVCATAKFVPATSDGETFVSVTFECPDEGGYEVVAFEEIERKGVTYAVHADIADEGQAVSIPAIRTTAADAKTATHTLHLGEGFELADTVAYKGLTPGAEYKLEGSVHVRGAAEDGTATDAGAFKDKEGKEVVAEATFTPEASSGEAVLSFKADAAVEPGCALVVFERLTRVSNGTLTAVHEDVEDAGQTVVAPKARTVATVGDTGEHYAGSVEAFTVNDDVYYSNVVPGEAYVVRGELHKVADDGTDAGAVEGADGKPVTATAEFTAEEAEGRVTLAFAVDPAHATGTIVVFEELDQANGGEYVPVAEHKDPTDTSQQVGIAAIGTTARDSASGGHEGVAEAEAKVVDTVAYSGLEPGAAYKLAGTLMDKSTGKALEEDGKAVTAEKAFRAEGTSGEVEMEFSVENTVLADTTVVVFEKLYEAGDVVAVHEDINSADQSVSYKAPALGPLGDVFDKTGYWLARYWWVLAVIGTALLCTGVFRYMDKHDTVFADEDGQDGAAEGGE